MPKIYYNEFDPKAAAWLRARNLEIVLTWYAGYGL
jgi:hypothetical protein